jgi:hypothetical protein
VPTSHYENNYIGVVRRLTANLRQGGDLLDDAVKLYDRYSPRPKQHRDLLGILHSSIGV